MRTHRPSSRHALLLAGGIALLASGIRTGTAQDRPADAKQVVATWNHPEAKPSSGASGSGDGTVAGLTFRVARPFEELWRYYAKKCGYTGSFPASDMTVAVSGGTSCVMMYENSTMSGGGVSAAFTYREGGTTISVSLADRKDGVRVFVAAAK